MVTATTNRKNALSIVGTPERDAFERSVDEAVQAYRVGEAIKQARESQNLTQAELGEKNFCGHLVKVIWSFSISETRSLLTIYK